jgi:F-type H+-transporting ATPase subunit gamma
LLPIDPQEVPAGQTSVPVEYLYEQAAGELLAGLLPRFVESQIFRALAESAASEHAARMTAMDSATSNAGELID